MLAIDPAEAPIAHRPRGRGHGHDYRRNKKRSALGALDRHQLGPGVPVAGKWLGRNLHGDCAVGVAILMIKI